MAASIYPIAMPKWGMEMSEGVINSWHLAEGEAIAPGAELVDIETSKIVNTLTADRAGTLRRILAQPGETLAVGALLGVVAEADTAEADIDAFIAAFGCDAGEQAADEPNGAAVDELSAGGSHSNGDAAPRGVAVNGLGEGGDDSAVPATPVARRLAAREGINLNAVLNHAAASGRGGRVTLADLKQAVAAAGGELALPQHARQAPRPSGADDSHIKATPVARRLAAELGINLNDCRASGRNGRVAKADVEAAAALRNDADKPANASVQAAVEPASQQANTPVQTQPLNGMRKTIAARLQQSKQLAPHFRVAVDVRLEALQAAREQLNAARSDARISVNDLLIKASAAVLQAVPALNIQFDGEAITRFADADIAVAVALEDGLITPVVRSANSKGVVQISNEVRDLATRAKLGRLQASEFQGGSFCISNLGMYGVKHFDAIINPPQAAILAVGGAERRPVVGASGELEVGLAMTLNLSSDHRVIDGATAAQFLQALKGFIERPATLLA